MKTLLFSLLFASSLTMADDLNGLDVVQLDLRKTYTHHPKLNDSELRTMFDKCNNGDAKICVSVAYRFTYGDGVELDKKVGFVIYKNTCDQLNRGCHAVADAYEYGNGVERNFDKATEYYKKDCVIQREFQQSLECGTIDSEETIRYKKECEEGNEDSCAEMSARYSLGVETEINIKNSYLYTHKLRKILKEKCQNGNQEACNKYDMSVRYVCDEEDYKEIRERLIKNKRL